MKKDIESSTTAYISYDEKEKKPKVLNEAAAMELVNIIDGHELSLDFEVDDEPEPQQQPDEAVF